MIPSLQPTRSGFAAEQTRSTWPFTAGTPPGVARVETGTVVARTVEAVFDFVTTTTLWHTWHPATVTVKDTPDHPLTVGEGVTETIAVAGRRAEARWTVLECERPGLWVIATDNASGSARIVYRLTRADGGCSFHRTLEFRSKTWPWRAFDNSLLTWVLARQSAKALANLKRVMEAKA